MPQYGARNKGTKGEAGERALKHEALAGPAEFRLASLTFATRGCAGHERYESEQCKQRKRRRSLGKPFLLCAFSAAFRRLLCLLCRRLLGWLLSLLLLVLGRMLLLGRLLRNSQADRQHQDPEKNEYPHAKSSTI
jgi:hypothetical protein